MQNLETDIKLFQEDFQRVQTEVAKVIVGMNDVLRITLGTIFAGGHVLLEGVPGLGKTLLVKSISKTLGLGFKRIQFTPDLMPSDITGTQILAEDEHGRKNFVFKQGPLFTNIVLADEINRATPKSQSALLEAMEERQVTVLNTTYTINEPFFVLATQNPIELEGTYPLPEAQLDRFMAKVIVHSPTARELKEIVKRTTGSKVPEARSIFSEEEGAHTVTRMRQLVRMVLVADSLEEVLVRMISALTPGNEFATEKVKKYVRFGPGPRGAQSVIMLSKVFALLDGRINLSMEDVKASLITCLRHRLILNFQAEADDVTADNILEEVKNAR